MRAYRHPADYELVYDLLLELYEPDTRLPYWLGPRWEYMHAHPYIERVDLSSIGIAESAAGRVLGLVHPEAVPEQRYLQVRPGHENVRPALLEWAERHPAEPTGVAPAGRVGVFVDDSDAGLQGLVVERGYRPSPREREPHACRSLDTPLPTATCPDGYHLQSLADDNDLVRLDRVLWRGFGHPGEPPADGWTERARSQATPNYRKDLNIVVVTPEGDFASYAGVWYVPRSRVAYVEPVATDPDHRRRGLARVAVIEGLRRVRREGATIAWVGSDQAFYRSLGFEVTASSTLWWRAIGQSP